MRHWADLFHPGSAAAESQRIDLDASPMEVAKALAGADHMSFLDSSSAGGAGGRYSVVAWEPFTVLTSKAGEVRVRAEGSWHTVGGDVLTPHDDVLTLLDDVLQAARVAESAGSGVPYGAGAIGYLGYDLYRFVERYERLEAVDDLDLPDCYLAFYDAVLVFDHAAREWSLSGAAVSRGSGPTSRLLERRERDLMARLAATNASRGTGPSGGAFAPAVPAPGTARRAQATDSRPPAGGIVSNMTRSEYLGAVEKALEHIRAGDVYQLNLSQRFEATVDAEPMVLFEALREVNPSAFGAFLPYGGHAVISSSPELYLRRSGRAVETKPIKGTRPRGRDAAEDEEHRQSLLTSAKDRAELSMIVDLERNDLGRVCEYGTVEVAEHRRVSQLPTVFHTVSTVRGRLRADVSSVDLLRATFPGGSVTGCPKIRAIEIIDQLEPTRRNAYCGAIGWLGFGGDMVLSIAIRTVITKGRRAYFQAGGAIVADSDPSAEYDETLDKAAAVGHALAKIGARHA